MKAEDQAAMNTKQAKHERILVVFPHPDDEAFVAAGTLAMYIEGGAQVTYACLTLGRWAAIWASRRSRAVSACQQSARRN